MRKQPDDQGSTQAVELLALIQAHPASTYETRQKAGRLLVESSPRMAPDEAEMAKERGRTLNLWEVVNKLEYP
jgi:hypothetical protein